MDKLNSKISQKDVRSLLNERKRLQQKSNIIVSPLAKTAIKTASLWRVHVNSKIHKNNVEEAKILNKKLFKNSSLTQCDIAKTEKPDTSKSQKKIPTVENDQQLHLNNKLGSNNVDKITLFPINALEVLPEMFFDDPVVDAKIRNIDYKDAQDDEWGKFQREIKEESVASNMIIAGEQTNSAVEREIIEINEQIHHWSKVLDLEEKAEKLQKTVKRCVDFENKDTDNDSSEEEMFNEYLDWRSKSCLS